MVCLRNICINTLHKGDNNNNNEDDDDDDDNNNNNNNQSENTLMQQIFLERLEMYWWIGIQDEWMGEEKGRED